MNTFTNKYYLYMYWTNMDLATGRAQQVLDTWLKLDFFVLLELNFSFNTII